MRRILVFAVAAIAATLLGGPGCSCNSTPKMMGDDVMIDAGVDGHPDAPPTQETQCENLPPVASGTCSVAGTGSATLLKGEVLAPGNIFHGGQVRIESGQIACVGCDCATGGETVVTCPDAVISPGLINTHDHIEYTHSAPKAASPERYEDRQQWRNGGAAYEGHTKITHASALDATKPLGLAQLQWGELRFVMGGATSVVGSDSTSTKGLVRNLDVKANEGDGVSRVGVEMDTFPLDNLAKGRQTANCDYGASPTTPTQVGSVNSYEPHTSEGIDHYAHNEFLCQSSTTYDVTATGTGEGGKSHDLLLPKTAMIHSIGLLPADYQQMAAKNVGLVWSPRSNISLYADTARLPIAARMGVEISLGTDWLPSGSMNLLRELHCADNINANYFNHFFSDEDLWKMATSNAASITATDDVLGILATGHLADVSIFNAHGKPPFRAILEADPQDVVLVMRSGTPLYGDADLIDGLTVNCDALDVCQTAKKVCLMADTGTTLAALTTAVGSDYPLFACGTPTNEPICTPVRATADTEDTSTYTGMPGSGDADGDGIPDATDLCPTMFDPIRPMDDGHQADADGDGVGDICDPCPTTANSTNCTMADPNDRDGDGIANATDNCPDVANPDQADADGDLKGDLCDSCPTANPGNTPCAAIIPDIKKGVLAENTIVEIQNMLVTGKATSGFFVQQTTGDPGYVDANYTGLFVFTGSGAAGIAQLANVTVNRRVTVDGTITNFNGEIELGTITAVTATSVADEAAPTPVAIASYADIVTGGTRASALEGVLVSAGSLTVTAYLPAYGELTCVDNATPANSIVVDDLLYATPNTNVGQKFSAATGILALRNSVSNLLPRKQTDLTLGAPGLESLSPALSYARIGSTAPQQTFPQALTVTLSGPAQGATDVMIMSNDGNLVVGNVTVADMATTAIVMVTVPSGAVPTADVTVSAMLGMQTAQAHVRVLGMTEGPTSVTLTPTDNTVSPNGTTQMTVTLDVPALTDTSVAIMSTAGGIVPASVPITAGTQTANFNYMDNNATGATTVTASFPPGADSTATVTVNTGASHLVINEVDYDNVGADTTEFVEIYNPSGSAKSLANVVLYTINGASSGSVIATFPLAAAAGGSLASHHYLLIGGPNVNVPAGSTVATKFDPGWTDGDLQNGAPDGVVLVDNSTHAVIDGLSYEGSITALTLPGFAAPVNLVSGTATSATDSGAGSLCRMPNGQDTDMDSMDWALCATTSPGADN